MRKTVVMISVAIGLMSAAAPAAIALDDVYINVNRFVGIGNKALVKGDFEKASHNLRRAVKSNLTGKLLVNTLNNLCAADFLLNKFDEAKKSCDKAIKLDRRAWRPYVIRGHINGKQGHADLARADYNRAQKLKPGEEISKRFLAKMDAGSPVKLAKNAQ